MNPMIRLDKVTFSFSSRTEPALKEINLSFQAGESVCVMGANGSGKTTLALILAGILKPTAGSVETSKELKPSIVFQNPENQMVATIVEKELAFSLENLATPQAEMERRIAEIAETFNLATKLRSATTKLSGGEQQKVALASVMITRPSLLILDEPDAFLDAAGREILRQSLAKIHKQYPDLIEIRIAQEIESAREYNRIIVLDRGEVAADGSPEVVLSDLPLLQRCRIVVEEESASFNKSNKFEWIRTNGSSATEVSVENVSFHYHAGKPILQDVNFTVNHGEIIGVAGSTGSGKSTLGLLLSGILTPTSGKIVQRNNGRELTDQSWVTMALQQAERQFFLRTCAEEIGFGPSNNGVKLGENEIDQLLEIVGLAPKEFRLRDPLSLSVGEQRRLATAVMLGLRKPFIVFDEPTAGLDADGVARFVSLSARLKHSGAGQLVISHDHRLLRRISDRVLKIELDGSAVVTNAVDFSADPAETP
jgi:energy-coupling factor transporter ATP-binding protein EcfA2